jgi:quercetin dioxygenase-like cupin family protein
MVEDRYRAQAEAFALGALESGEQRELEDHLAAGCSGCREAVESARSAIAALPLSYEAAALPPVIRATVLDLAEAPALPLDTRAYSWQEPYPGVRTAVVKVDPARSFCATLIWAAPGARYPAHRHRGEETTLILQGSCRDEHGSYAAGDVARMRAGSTHWVEFLPGEDCIGYLVAYDGHEIVGP